MWQEKLRIHKTNPITGLYPFAKLWVVLFYSISVLILSSIRLAGYPVYMMLSLFPVFILVAFSGTMRRFLKVLNKMFFLCVFIVIVQALFVRTDDVLVSWRVFDLFGMAIYRDSLQYSLVLAFSILCVGGILAWFFGATENKELICACEKRGLDPKAAYILLSTLQMISVLQQNAKIIMSSQQARGVETEGNLITRSKAFIPSMIPLVLGAITNTEERVLSLESKGFLVKGKRTRLFDVQPNGKERIAVLCSLIPMILIIIWRIYLWLV